ncbi:Transcriptional regulator, NifA subfamily, Fis Family [Syntrophobacter sp. SbD1]|nr:Transcriptional regulator, NifA subfamily, Fis Family [Syntrophobacter sp. SbD1]
MGDKSFDFYRTVSEELDPERLQRKFLAALLDLQNVERGSIWVRSDKGYTCIEAAGAQSEHIRSMTIDFGQSSIVGWVIENGKMTIAEAGKDARHFRKAEEKIDLKSRLILCFPLVLRTGEVYGAVQLIDTSAGGNRLNLKKNYLELVQQLIDIGSIALSNSLVFSEQAKENLKLKQTLKAIREQDMIIGKSAALLGTRKRAAEYARTDFPVLITGESGSGKELLAREIHRLSARGAGPFLAQNCSCIPDTLLESELFGHEKGAFTGAFKTKPGLFEAANDGSVFLDEIGDMPLQLQARILRVIQDGEIKPIGNVHPRKVNVRIISATNRDLQSEIARENFREDLFYRLNVLPLHIPALRERAEDMPLLLDHFLSREALRLETPRKTFSKEALNFLLEYEWPGNVRELENFVKHIIVITPGDLITPEDLSNHFFSIASNAHCPSKNPPNRNMEEADQSRAGQRSIFDGYSWDELEREYVLHLLEKNKWHVTRAAKEAGVNRSTFDSRMKKLNIRK